MSTHRYSVLGHSQAIQLRLASLVLLLFCTTSIAWSAPGSPENLKLVRYSGTNAELFWDRVDQEVLSYEITRNNSVLGTTNGISYYDGLLNEAGAYLYLVVAIDANGERSEPSRLIVGTTGQPSVEAPQNLRAILYSRTAGELFWERSSSVGTTYEIRRDDVLLGTTDGISFYDGRVLDAQTHEYGVIAVNAKGARSSASTVRLTDRPDDDDPPNDDDSNNKKPPLAGNIQLDIYSRSAIELSWDRVSGRTLSYEIVRDGSFLATTSGTSFYNDDLDADRSYLYEITTIDESGNRSGAVEVTLKARLPDNDDDNSGDDDKDDDRDDDRDDDDRDDDDRDDDDDKDDPVIRFDLSESPASDIDEPSDYYQRNGYADTDVIRVDIRTETTPGECTADDLSGCTLDDLLADIDKTDDLKVEIEVHVKADDFADDGSISNATMRMRGGGSRLGAQKSFRVKLDSKKDLWRNERFWQLNKTPFDSSRIRNPLSFKIMSEIPHLPSVRTQFVNLWIDDGDGPVDQGLYHHVERINETYLKNRDLDDDGNLYDAEDFKFDLSDLSDLAVDDEGEPLNEDFFESSLGISEGKDHRPLIAMLTDLNDPDRSFESVLDQYFDANNVMAWMATNLLIGQYDSVRHNYYLFNPSDSEKFYFLPWDYDLALSSWEVPPSTLDDDALRLRLSYGYAVGEPNVFISKFYRLPGIHQEILKAARYIRQNHVTDDFVAENAQAQIELVEPFQSQQPDEEFNPYFTTYSAVRFAKVPANNEEAMRSAFSIPLPPTLYAPEDEGDSWVFSWKAAFDVTGNDISYDLLISENPGFNSSDIVFSETGIESSNDIVTYRIDSDRFRKRDYYVRLIARANNDPDRFWQVALNRLTQGGETYRGMLRFDVD